MKPPIQNTQHCLANQLIQIDNSLTQESKIAFLKVQSWQFAINTPEIGKAYLLEAASMIKRSLLCYVPNSFVLAMKKAIIITLSRTKLVVRKSEKSERPKEENVFLSVFRFFLTFRTLPTYFVSKLTHSFNSFSV